MNSLKLLRPALTPFANKLGTCDSINSLHIVIEVLASKSSYFCLRFFLHIIRSILNDLEFLLFVKTNLHFELPLQRMANILVKKNEEEVVIELCKLVEKEAKDAIAAHGTFHLGLSGGSLASFLCRSRADTSVIISDNKQSYASIPEACHPFLPTGLLGDCSFAMKDWWLLRTQTPRGEFTGARNSNLI